MKQAVGAALILLTFTITACSPSGPEPDRSWSEFVACARAFSRGHVEDGDDEPYWMRLSVEDFRNGKDKDPSPGTIACEKAMPILTAER